jgi:hypothetical protein
MSGIIKVSSIFPALPDAIWPLLMRLDTLRYIAAPWAVFAPAGSQDGAIWRENESYCFRLRIFGVLPLGIHTVRIQTLDSAGYNIQTAEENKFVPVWKHKITLIPQGADSSFYTDEVEIDAGLLTGLVYCWGTAFYRHRQRKWLRLLKKKAAFSHDNGN